MATVSAQISQSIKKEGSKSPYVRVAKGTYALAVKSTGSTANAQAPSAAQSSVPWSGVTQEEQPRRSRG